MKKTPTDYPSLSPAIAVKDAAKAIKFYTKVLGAKELYRLVDPDSGKVGHAELMVSGSLLMLGEENPAYNKGPKTLGGTPVKLCLMVADVDKFAKKAKKAGAKITMEPSTQFYGHRSASFKDPFGHEWMIFKEVEKISPKEMQKRWNDLAKKK